MRASRVEAVLVSGVGQGDLLAVRGPVREPSLCCHGGAFWAGGARGPALVGGYAVASFVAEKRKVTSPF